MWVCPICSNKEKKENVCGSCGYDNRKDFLRYQTLCVVPKEDIEEWNKLSNKSCKKSYSDGSWYEGELLNGQCHGKGVYVYSNGVRYEGEFKNNERHGKGVMVYMDGTRYEGEFRNGEFHGKGICYFASGDRYEGDFSNSHRHGEGILYYTNGTRYEGQFVNGDFHGKGVCYFADGQIQDGRWEKGTFVEEKANEDESSSGFKVYKNSSGFRVS